MIRRDLDEAKFQDASKGKLDFHCLRHTLTTALGRHAPLKVVQELARHSTPLLTVSRYSHTELTEKVLADAAIPMGTATPAGFTDQELEILAGCFFALADVLFPGSGYSPITSLVTPEVDTEGHLPKQSGTDIVSAEMRERPLEVLDLQGV